MYENLLISLMLTIPLIFSHNNCKVINSTQVLNKTKVESLQNFSSLAIVSEGGTLIPKNVLPLTLPKENHTNLMSLDKEIGRTKEKSIVARKGAVFTQLEENVHKNTDSAKDRVDTTVSKLETNVLKEEKKNSSAVLSVIGTTSKMSLNTSGIVTTTSTKRPEPKKPLFVSYEALGETDNKAVHSIEYSSKLMVTDQLPTPNIRTHPVNSHPGMVMPLVITILVVPMFVVLGYMALRKGKEAWKNRHYKRMDFLLDGMYND